MSYRYLFFDLDGTLTDSGPGIMNSVVYALNRMGAPVPDRAALTSFIGPPLAESFQSVCGFTPERAREALGLYREYFTDTGIFENALYPGIPELLSALKAAGRTVALATAKPEPFALRILDHFGISDYFDFRFGATMDETRSRKDQVIRYALDRSGAPPAETLMIGDRDQDVWGAAKNGVDCLGALYGYGSRRALEEAGAKYFAEDAAEIKRLLSDGVI